MACWNQNTLNVQQIHTCSCSSLLNRLEGFITIILLVSFSLCLSLSEIWAEPLTALTNQMSLSLSVSLSLHHPPTAPTSGSVQSLSCVQLFATPWTTACQASLSITNFRSLPKPLSIESVMPSNHLILCRPLLLLPSIFPSIRVFSNESDLRIR